MFSRIIILMLMRHFMRINISIKGLFFTLTWFLISLSNLLEVMIFQVITFWFVKSKFQDTCMLKLFYLILNLLFTKYFDCKLSCLIWVSLIFDNKLLFQSSNVFVIFFRIISFWDNFILLRLICLFIYILRLFWVCEGIEFYVLKITA